jgi:hypothetical protein
MEGLERMEGVEGLDPGISLGLGRALEIYLPSIPSILSILSI